MIGTRLKEQCGKDKKFKTSKELAECIGISSNMFYLITQNKKSMSLKSLRSLVSNTGISANYFIGLTSEKNIAWSGMNKQIPFKYELNLNFLKKDSDKNVKLIAAKLRELDNTSNTTLEKQLEFVDSLKPNNAVFNRERLKVIMEATGYISTTLAKALNCKKTTVDGWINKNTIPNIKNFEKIIYILQCSGDFLLNMTNDPNILWGANENIINSQGISNDGTKQIYDLYGKHIKDFT